MTVPVIPPTAPVPWGSNVLAALKSALNGTGALVGTTSPALVTPALGVATGTSLSLANGTSLLPSLSTTASSGNSGIFFPNSGYDIGFSYTGSQYAQLNNTIGFRMGSVGPFAWSSGISGSASADTSIYRDAAGITAQRVGTAAQSHRVYNTYTDASNYERGIFDWQGTANVLSIGTEKAGTGVTRNWQMVAGGTKVLDYGITNSGSVTATGIFYATSTIAAATHRHPPAATFPGSPSTGDIASVNTATSPTIGSTVALGGAAFALGVYNGTQWTCIGK